MHTVTTIGCVPVAEVCLLQTLLTGDTPVGSLMQRAGKKIAAIAQPMGFMFISSRLIVGFIRTAHQHGVSFIYGLSPGMDITYSSQKEMAALKRKLDQVRRMALGENAAGSGVGRMPVRTAGE